MCAGSCTTHVCTRDLPLTAGPLEHVDLSATDVRRPAVLMLAAGGRLRTLQLNYCSDVVMEVRGVPGL